MNRGDDKELYETNVLLVQELISAIGDAGSVPHVVFSSSIQRGLDNPYGRSKKAGEEIISGWADQRGASATMLEVPNVYGQACRPFYNSVVATFCYQLTHGETPEVHEDRQLELIYVGDLCERILDEIRSAHAGVRNVQVDGSESITVRELLSLLEGFKDHYFNRMTVPDLSVPLHAKLYRTFITYLEAEDLLQVPEAHEDGRGGLFEVVRQRSGGGQVFFSSTRPGVIRGNHYHTRKLEKFCIIKGSAVVRFRRIGDKEVREIRVDGGPAVVEIPVFCAHQIENTGEDDLLTLFWTSEIYEPGDPDTYFEEI
jgi:UDP-2-acetamido-2,6-beta-L-arabino-hexul-4-ose reductase